MMEVQTFIICVSTERHSVKRPFEAYVKDIAKYEGIYFDRLQSLFTEVTGLRTHLEHSRIFPLRYFHEQVKADKERRRNLLSLFMIG